MKGKGKGERIDIRDCPLQFPDLNPVDHNRMCPRYTAVLQRSEDNGIGLEELDTLQSELETLLASVAKRMRLLENESTILNTWQEKGKDKGKGQPEVKRAGKGGDDKPSKKFKDASGKASLSTPGSTRPKGKVQTIKMQEFELPESPKTHEIPRIPKNDTPNRFWALVEPYCAEITSDDIRVLEDVMRSHEDDAEYHKVPILGKHYSQKWAQEDMLDEHRESTKVNEKRRSVNSSTNSNNNSTEASLLLKRAEERLVQCISFNSDDDSSPFGPLTQRLVSALIEENIMTPLDDTTMAETELNAAEAATMSPRSLAKQLNIGNTISLERRIKRELQEQGILEADDRTTDDNPEDEILSELRKKQQDLRVMSQHTLKTSKNLIKLAKEEMQRQDLRHKLAAADAEVMDAYRKIQASRLKKKAPSKKEKDAAYKALKEREGIVKNLEAME